MLAKIILAGLAAGLIYLFFFNRPHHPTTAELLAWFDSRLHAIHNELEHDIELDKQGQYPHQGRHDFERKGVITYPLLDKHDVRYDLSENDAITLDEIRSTEAWQALEAKVNELGLQIALEENIIEGDEVDDDYSLDEHIDDVRRYYTVTVSGW